MKAFRHCPWASADIPGVITYDRDRPALTSQRRRRTDGEDFCPSGVVAEVEGERVPHHLLREEVHVCTGEERTNSILCKCQRGRDGSDSETRLSGARVKSQIVFMFVITFS